MMRPDQRQRLSAFEGLVISTSRMFAGLVDREEEDLAQELRVRVWRAIETHDPAKSKVSLERYVFSVVTNKVKDFKRDAAREMKRRERFGLERFGQALSFGHIEDMRGEGGASDHFDGLHQFVARDEVYREVDEGRFTLPATVTEREATVLLFAMMGMTKVAIAAKLTISRPAVDAAMAALREKFADWKPDVRPDASRVVDAERLLAA